MKTDKNFISKELHEIEHIQNTFLSKNNEAPPAPLLYFLQYVMDVNKGQVSREDFYKILELLGYSNK